MRHLLQLMTAWLAFAVTTALPTPVHGGEKYDLTKELHKYPDELRDDIERLDLYVNSLRWISEDDRNDLKQTGVLNLLLLRNKSPLTPFKSKFAVSQELRRIVRDRNRWRSLDRLEQLIPCPTEEGGPIDDVLEMDPIVRDNYLKGLADLERKNPQKFGDLLAYVALARVRRHSDPESFLDLYRIVYPTATARAFDCLSENRNTFYHRTRDAIDGKWGWVAAAIGVAFVAFLIIRLLGGGPSPDFAYRPTPLGPLPSAPTYEPTTRPETVKDPRDAQWEAYSRYRRCEDGRYVGAGAPSYR
jgi:hypothetical protein